MVSHRAVDQLNIHSSLFLSVWDTKMDCQHLYQPPSYKEDMVNQDMKKKSKLAASCQPKSAKVEWKRTLKCFQNTYCQWSKEGIVSGMEYIDFTKESFPWGHCNNCHWKVWKAKWQNGKNNKEAVFWGKSLQLIERVHSVSINVCLIVNCGIQYYSLPMASTPLSRLKVLWYFCVCTRIVAFNLILSYTAASWDA